MTLPKTLLIPLALLALVTTALVATFRTEPTPPVEPSPWEGVAVAETPAPALPAPEAADGLEATRLEGTFDEPQAPFEDPFTFDEPSPESASGTIVLTIHDPSAFRDPGVRRGGFTIDESASWEQAWLVEWPASQGRDAREPREQGPPPPRGHHDDDVGPGRRGPPPGAGAGGRGAGGRGGGQGRGGEGRGGGQGAPGGGCSR